MMIQSSQDEFENICSKHNVSEKLSMLEAAICAKEQDEFGEDGENAGEDDTIIASMSTKEIVGALRSRTMPVRCKEVTLNPISNHRLYLALPFILLIKDGEVGEGNRGCRGPSCYSRAKNESD